MYGTLKKNHPVARHPRLKPEVTKNRLHAILNWRTNTESLAESCQGHALRCSHNFSHAYGCSTPEAAVCEGPAEDRGLEHDTGSRWPFLAVDRQSRQGQ